jgi:hypothetical protein
LHQECAVEQINQPWPSQPQQAMGMLWVGSSNQKAAAAASAASTKLTALWIHSSPRCAAVQRAYTQQYTQQYRGAGGCSCEGTAAAAAAAAALLRGQEATQHSEPTVQPAAGLHHENGPATGLYNWQSHTRDDVSDKVTHVTRHCAHSHSIPLGTSHLTPRPRTLSPGQAFKHGQVPALAAASACGPSHSHICFFVPTTSSVPHKLCAHGHSPQTQELLGHSLKEQVNCDTRHQGGGSPTSATH